MSRFYISVVDPGDPVAISDVRRLFNEYHAWLGDVVCSTHLGEEIDSLPRPYVEPEGRLLIARDDSGSAVGCVGVRPHSGDSCEIKRLFVSAGARGAGLGRQLTRYAIEAGRELGYSEARITTLPDTMAGALRMYPSLGFEETEPFQDFSHVQEDVRILFLSRGI